MEKAAAQMCREGGGRVSTNVIVRNMDVPSVAVGDAKRFEILVDGLSMFNGSQLAVDTTLVSPLRRDGTARPSAATKDGAAFRFARKDKERTYPELTGKLREITKSAADGQQRLNNLALAHARAQSVTKFCRAKAARAWLTRWKRILACTAARAFAVSLGEAPISGGEC